MRREPGKGGAGAAAPPSAPAAEGAEAIPQRLGIWPLAWPAIVGNLLHATVGLVWALV